MYKTEASVPTVKVSRYLKALCNFFDRKVSATYDEVLGKVEFGFAYCKTVPARARWSLTSTPMTGLASNGRSLSLMII